MITKDFNCIEQAREMKGNYLADLIRIKKGWFLAGSKSQTVSIFKKKGGVNAGIQTKLLLTKAETSVPKAPFL